MQDIKDIVIVGGGTAGWLTALFIRNKFPKSYVTVIESSEIGILGAGEGTTPHFIGLLHELDINVEDVIRYAKGTFKNGIKFTNWCGDNTHYYHGFLDERNIFIENYTAYLKNLINNSGLYDLSYQEQVSEDNKVKFAKKHNYNLDGDTLNDFNNHGSYALHFDATLLAKLLKKIAISRNIQCIDGVVNIINTDSKEFITSLNLDSNREVKCDFVFDCTGFKRLIIGQFYKSQWIDYSKTIPNNRALPFFLDNHGSTVPPYTESIAMKYGWVWKIPVQGRFGCGYVFDSKQVSDEEILAELEEYFGQKITSPRAFNFNAGCYKDTWVKNCIAIGLSTGFIEPLEATSIMLSIISLRRLNGNLPGIYFRDENYIKNYNTSVRSFNTSILDFIYFHYITQRTDTKYWKNFTDDNTIPLTLRESIEALIDSPTVNLENFEHRNLNKCFDLYSFTMVGNGLKLLNKNKLDNLKISIEQTSNLDFFKQHELNFKKDIKTLSSSSIDHYNMIEYIKGNNEN